MLFKNLVKIKNKVKIFHVWLVENKKATIWDKTAFQRPSLKYCEYTKIPSFTLKFKIHTIEYLAEI